MLNLLLNQSHNLSFFGGRRAVTHKLEPMCVVSLPDGVVVVRGCIILDDAAQAKKTKAGVQSLLVYLDGFGCVLHSSRGLELRSLFQVVTTFRMPLLDLREGTVFPLVFWRGSVGIIKVGNVVNVVVVATRSCLHDPADHGIAVAIPVLVLEESADTNVLRVSEKNLAVRRAPRNSYRFCVTTNASPEINSFFHSSLFAFVSWRLEQNKTQVDDRQIILKNA